MAVKCTRYSFRNQKSFWFFYKECGLCLSTSYNSPGTCTLCPQETRDHIRHWRSWTGVEWLDGGVGCFILLQSPMEPSCGAVVVWHHAFPLSGVDEQGHLVLLWSPTVGYDKSILYTAARVILFKCESLWTLKRQQIHSYQQLNPKTTQTNKLSKQPEQEQNHRYGDYLEGYQLGNGRMGK